MKKVITTVLMICVLTVGIFGSSMVANAATTAKTCPNGYSQCQNINKAVCDGTGKKTQECKKNQQCKNTNTKKNSKLRKNSYSKKNSKSNKNSKGNKNRANNNCKRNCR